MKTIRISLATLLLTICTALAVPPTNTEYRVVQVNTNGVLVGIGTNLAAANGLAGTGSVAAAAQTAASGLATGITAQAAATLAMATGLQAQASASLAMATGVQAQASASLAMATGLQAQASADLAMQEAQRGVTNVTGLLTWTDRIIGLSAAVVSNAMAGIYALVDHLHGYTAITNAPWSAQADYVVTSNTAAGAWNESVFKYWLSPSTNVTTIANSPGAMSIGKSGVTTNSITDSPGGVQALNDYSSFETSYAKMIQSPGGIQRGGSGGKHFVEMEGSISGVQLFGLNSAGNYTPESQPLYMTGSDCSIQIAARSMQRLYMYQACGAIQIAGAGGPAAVINSGGDASIQLMGLNSRGTNYMTGSASIGLGEVNVSDHNAIVAGDGQVSHGDGSITAGGGFYGPGTGLTNLTPAQIGAVWKTNLVLAIDGTTNTIVYLGAP